MEYLNNYMVPVITGICLCLGYVIKKWVYDVDNRYIPTFCAFFGLVLAIWINGWNVSPEIILSGLFSGLSATGLHQMFKQVIERDDKNE